MIAVSVRRKTAGVLTNFIVIATNFDFGLMKIKFIRTKTDFSVTNLEFMARFLKVATSKSC